jgi:hypothetical protein
MSYSFTDRMYKCAEMKNDLKCVLMANKAKQLTKFYPNGNETHLMWTDI